jgi:aryl-alcohol dehydrogenase-like predicted oxidoreductase
MEIVPLGGTDLKVSRLTFGAWGLRGEWGPVWPDTAIDAICRAWDLGINLFDTAQGYSGGSERLVATALRNDVDHARDEVQIASKGGVRLTTDPAVPLEETVRAGYDLVTPGKIRQIGVPRGDSLLRHLEVVRALRSLAAQFEVAVSQLAIAWVLDNPAVDTAIVGARNGGQVAEGDGGAELILSDTDRARIAQAIERSVLVGRPSPEAMP